MNLQQIFALYNGRYDKLDEQTKNSLLTALANTKNVIGNDFECFLNLVCIKTQCFETYIENLNISDVDEITYRWPHLAVRYDMKSFVKNEQLLANYVYAFTHGNGNHISNDGYVYRKRGALVNICGRNIYLKCSKDLFGDDRLIVNPDLISTNVEYAFKSAVWFWQKFHCADYVNNLDVLLKVLNRSNIPHNQDVNYICDMQTKLHEILETT